MCQLWGWGSNRKDFFVMVFGQQYSRNESNFSSSEALSRNSEEFISHDSYKQGFSSGLHSEKRGNLFSNIMYRWKFGKLLFGVKEREYLSARHIAGKSYILADRLSRMYKPISTEWSLKQNIYSVIFLRTGHPNIERFATQLNNRLPLYVSPISDNQVLAIDALSTNWDRKH